MNTLIFGTLDSCQAFFSKMLSNFRDAFKSCGSIQCISCVQWAVHVLNRFASEQVDTIDTNKNYMEIYGNMFSTFQHCGTWPQLLPFAALALLQAGLSLPQPSPHRVPFRGTGDRLGQLRRVLSVSGLCFGVVGTSGKAAACAKPVLFSSFMS